VRQNGLALRYVGTDFKDDAEIVAAAAAENKDALQYASAEKREVYSRMQEQAAAIAPSVVNLIAQRLPGLSSYQGMFVMKAMTQAAVDRAEVDKKGFNADILNETLKPKSKTIALLQRKYRDAVEANGLSLQNLPPEIRKNRGVVFAAVRQNGLALQYASDDLKDDKDIVLAAVNQNGEALQYASDALKTDEAVVSAATEQNERASQPGSGGALK
jgi:hypothetical protein